MYKTIIYIYIQENEYIRIYIYKTTYIYICIIYLIYITNKNIKNIHIFINLPDS